VIENRTRGRKEERGERKKRLCTLLGCFRKSLQAAQRVSHAEMRVRVFSTVPVSPYRKLVALEGGLVETVCLGIQRGDSPGLCKKGLGKSSHLRSSEDLHNQDMEILNPSRIFSWDKLI